MKLSIFIVVLFAFGAKQAYSQACHMREIDLCVAIGTFHFHSNGLPANEEAVDDWCETMKEVEDCMGNFTVKCMSPVQRELIGLLSGSDDSYRQFCTPGTELRARYLDHGECLANGAESDRFKTEMKDLSVAIERLFEVPFKQRYPLMCCAFRRFHVNIEEMTVDMCGQAAVEMIKNVLKMITTEMPEMMCAKYDSKSDECVGLMPPTGTPSKGSESKSQLGKLLDTVMGNL